MEAILVQDQELPAKTADIFFLDGFIQLPLRKGFKPIDDVTYTLQGLIQLILQQHEIGGGRIALSQPFILDQ